MMRWFVLTLVIVLCAGCAIQPSVVLDQQYQQNAVAESVAIAKCRYVITNVSDNRKDKQSLGNLGYTHVSSEDVLQWVKNGLASAGFEAAPVLPDGRRVVQVNVELKLANVKASSTSMATNLVVGIFLDDKPKKTYLRGNNCAINWSSSREGIKASFDKALGKVLAQLIELSEAHCTDCMAVLESDKL